MNCFAQVPHVIRASFVNLEFNLVLGAEPRESSDISERAHRTHLRQENPVRFGQSLSVHGHGDTNFLIFPCPCGETSTIFDHARHPR